MMEPTPIQFAGPASPTIGRKSLLPKSAGTGNPIIIFE
jgi:hypothetical protein